MLYEAQLMLYEAQLVAECCDPVLQLLLAHLALGQELFILRDLLVIVQPLLFENKGSSPNLPLQVVFFLMSL